MRKRAKIIFHGIVQGVGFRPFIHRLAAKYKLNGWAQNTTEGVTVEVEGQKNAVGRFYKEALENKPAPSQIDDIKISYLKIKGYKDFKIRKSSFLKEKKVLVTPDISVCPRCAAELKNPRNRRYEHPFISCTDCGPRFTIIKDLPYDRQRITMKKFRMCPECRMEYNDIRSRRYHTQPIACNNCGPEAMLVKPGNKKTVLKDMDAIRESVKLLKKGKILAVKGLGGFHLACIASGGDVVEKLRKRKSRPFKPFAVMSADIESVKRYCYLTNKEEKILTGWRRPIVLLRKKANYSKYISRAISPGNDCLGVMLPYTPLHYLLFNELKKNGKKASTLVMTSGNIPGRPLEIDNITAMKRLNRIAEYFLIHNRDIYNRCDDSIVLPLKASGSNVIRRARGFVPLPLEMGVRTKNILACGAELNSAFCLTKENRAFVSQYIGDLKNYENYMYFRQTIGKFKALLDISPEIVAHDMHPDYFSTKFAFEYAKNNKCRLIPVQHHHAHVASCMIENGIKNKVIGVVLDGTGYGVDANIWGGEWFVADRRGFKREGHLRYTAMPGGDKAVEEPWRMAVSYLRDAFCRDIPDLEFMRGNRKKVNGIISMIDSKLNSPLTSSMGRLFDGVSALLDICGKTTYDAQPAMELEFAASSGRKRGCYEFEINNIKGVNIVNTATIIKAIVGDMRRGLPGRDIALKFHFTVVDIIDKMSRIIRKEKGINEIVLSGGVFQNRIIMEESVKVLASSGFKVYFNKQYPCNDGGISLGQAAVAMAKLKGK